MNRTQSGESLRFKQIEAMIAPGGIQKRWQSGPTAKSRVPKRNSADGFWGRANRAANDPLLKKFSTADRGN